jgi:hypothetical protein
LANYQYIDSTGVIIPDTADILATVQDEFKSALGQGLDISPETPQGRLITAEVASRVAVINNNAAIANQINPNIAGGIFLDAIWALMGGERTLSTASTVMATVSGVPNDTIIPAGSRAQTTSGDVFYSSSGVRIGSTGKEVVKFISNDMGPIVALAGTLTTIIDDAIGWETINNFQDATLGTLTQSDTSARLSRRRTLGLIGVSMPEAITSFVYNVTGVKSLSFRENTTSSPITIDNVTLAPHSIYLCVDGGSDLGVATAIYNSKSAGAGYNGTTTISVTDSVSNQSQDVKFSRPVLINISASVQVKYSTGITDPAASVRNAILSYAAGTVDGEDGFVVGRNISAFELAGAINIIYPQLFVTSVQVGLTSAGQGGLGVSEIPILISQKATITTGNIAVIIV